MRDKRPIRSFNGRIQGYIITDTVTGDKQATDFYGRTLGTYRKATDDTLSFPGNQILAKGDILASLIVQEYLKEMERLGMRP